MVQQVTVSSQATCANPKNIGWCSVLQVTWDNANHFITHPKAIPLECVVDEDVEPFRVRFNGLPLNYVLGVAPIGVNNTSTATLTANDVIFTLPAVVNVTEAWLVTMGPANQPAVDQICVKVKRTMPG